MEAGFLNHNSPENSGGDSPRSADTKVASTSSSKRSRRAVQKRAVLVPIVKGDQMKAPPSDSWAWRKYGQKPIKGSPYPRGYYRCSSSKGCPARKQVERSRVDPKMLVVTYYCEHNHNWPESRTNHHKPTASAAAIAARNVKASVSSSEEEEEEEEEDNEEEEEEDEVEEEKPRVLLTNQLEETAAAENTISTNLAEAPPAHSTEFGWFADFESTSFTTLEMESPMMLIEDRISTDTEMAMIFAMREEDESLFAGLGELPECSTVFRRGMVEREAEQRRPGLATTG